MENNQEPKTSQLKNLIRLLIGLVLYGVGEVLTIHANLGLSPWDTFSKGVCVQTGITMGQASIVIGLIILVFDWIFKEKVGIGTVLNILLIGTVMDFLMLNNIIPSVEHNFVVQLLMMVSGILVIGLATYLYIGACFGSGPRDGLMIAMHKKTGKSVRTVRIGIETTVFIIGFLLGGPVGVGTLIMAFGLGISTQFFFKRFHFNVKELKHHYIDEDLRRLFGKKKPDMAETSVDVEKN